VSTNMLMISDRGPSFWDTHHFSEKPNYAYVQSDGSYQIIDPDQIDRVYESLKDKKVLFLVHGFNTPKASILKSYFKINTYVNQLELQPNYLNRALSTVKYYLGMESQVEKSPPYDAVIGHIWPGYEDRLYYHYAKHNAKVLAPRINQELKKLNGLAQRVDVIAHSLGNYALFEALELDQSLKIGNIFSIAAALPNDCLDPGKAYENIAQKCQALYVLCSKNDNTLDWGYYIAEGTKKALGLAGNVCYETLARNIQVVNCSAVVDHHSGYVHTNQIYQFIEDALNSLNPSPYEAKKVTLLSDGSLEVIHERKEERSYLQIFSDYVCSLT
jgi:hypothetical protein